MPKRFYLKGYTIEFIHNYYVQEAFKGGSCIAKTHPFI